MSAMRLQVDETMTDVMTDCTALQDARTSHCNEDDPVTFLCLKNQL